MSVFESPGGDVDDEHLGFAAGQSVGELAFQSVGRDDLKAVEGVENFDSPRAVSVRQWARRVCRSGALKKRSSAIRCGAPPRPTP